MNRQHPQGQAKGPFSCTYSPNLPELLMQMNCTIALSTYQAGKVVFVSAQDADKLIQLPRNFNHAMALGLYGNRLAVAAKHEVIVLAHDPGLAAAYPKQPNTYDSLFVPRASYYTGAVDIHGLEWGKAGLWAVNTSFSCLCLLNDQYSFIPRWKPSFISGLASEDRCHLNGVAMNDGEPLYVTTMGHDDSFQSWRKTIPNGGTVINVRTNEIIMENLPMPHSPRLYDGKLYMLFSATGEIVAADPEKRTYDVVNKVDGFVRGLARHADHIFVAHSKLRQNSSTFKDLPIAKKAVTSGVTIFHLPTGARVAELKYETTVDEIFDIQVIPGLKRPGIVSPDQEVHRLSLVIPGTSFWAKPEEEKKIE
ncbi:MAG: TIGR03032 family protein [Spirochaetales bacterium]|nr:TIGR03032 family protein [Spirochaetales bacterium]